MKADRIMAAAFGLVLGALVAWVVLMLVLPLRNEPGKLGTGCTQSEGSRQR